MANFAKVLLQCEKPLHHGSDALTSSFALSKNRVTVKIWSQYLQYLQSYLEMFIPLAKNRQYITCLSIYYRDMACFDELHLSKSRSACSELGQNTELNRLNDGDFPLHALRFARAVPRAQVAFLSEPSRNLDIISTRCAYTLSYRRARSPQPHAARDRARRCRSLNILTACELMGLSSRRQLLLLASHRVALPVTRKCKNSRFAQFSIFAWLVSTLVPKHNSRF